MPPYKSNNTKKENIEDLLCFKSSKRPTIPNKAISLSRWNSVLEEREWEVKRAKFPQNHRRCWVGGTRCWVDGNRRRYRNDGAVREGAVVLRQQFVLWSKMSRQTVVVEVITLDGGDGGTLNFRWWRDACGVGSTNGCSGSLPSRQRSIVAFLKTLRGASLSQISRRRRHGHCQCGRNPRHRAP